MSHVTASGRQATRRDIPPSLLRHLTRHDPPNVCLIDIAQLSREAERAPHQMRRLPTLLDAVWHQIGIALMS